MTGRRLLVSLLTPVVLATPLLAGADASSVDEMERLLLEGAIVHTDEPPGGTSKLVRATLRLGDLEHRAVVHTHDEWRASFQLVDRTELDFRDSYKNNIAAYRLDRMLGLGMVPVTVLRNHQGRPASFMWWLEDVMDEAERLETKTQAPDPGFWARQGYVYRIFDELIHNFDRNPGNLLIDEEWQLWLIDHTRSFKVFNELRNPKHLGVRCERDLLTALRRLDEAGLRETMEGVLNPDQIQGILGRRDLIVAHFDALIAERGEIIVLFDLPPRGGAEVP